jgi:membrane-bound metal-dependent hydrolase YbcI (DUF457 family)
MFVEHVVYSLVIAIVLTLFLDKKIAGWCTLIVVTSACIPDLDGIIDLIQHPLVFSGSFLPHMTIHSRYFHTMGALVIYAILAGVLLARYRRLKFPVIAIFAGIGFGAHLFEDALVYNPAEPLFWPISSEMTGLGVFPSYSRDFLGVANGEVLLIGIVLLAVAIALSVALKRTEWASMPWLNTRESQGPATRTKFMSSGFTGDKNFYPHFQLERGVANSSPDPEAGSFER